MSKKLYFIQYNDDIVDDYEYCHPLSHCKEVLKESGELTLKLTEAIPERMTDIAWCKWYGEFIETPSDSCGKLCEHYKPRNGKTGRCRHHSVYSYNPHGRTMELKYNPSTDKFSIREIKKQNSKNEDRQASL